MKRIKNRPLFTALVLLMLVVFSFLIFTTINAKYVQTTDPSIFYLTIVPITYDCVLENDTTFNTRVKAVAADIEILYFCSYERETYTESGDGPLVEVPKSGSDFDWKDGVDVGEVTGSIRFFYDASAKTGYVISRRAENNASPNIIQANDASRYLFNGMDSLREIYFLDYNGDYDVMA